MAESERERMERPNGFACKTHSLQQRGPKSEEEVHYQPNTSNNNRHLLSSAVKSYDTPESEPVVVVGNGQSLIRDCAYCFADG